jgi:hypothetical protein
MKGENRILNRDVGKLAVTTVVTAMLLLSQGCKKSAKETGTHTSSGTPAAPRLTSASGSAKVTYQPNVRIMEREEGQKALIGVSSNDAALLFDASNSTARGLKAGDVLVIKGWIARSVMAVETTPDGVMVLTQQATIPEVIQEGEISFQQPVRFGGTAAANQPGPSGFPSLPSLFSLPTVYAQSPEGTAMSQAEQKGTRDAYASMIKSPIKALLEGWDVAFGATPELGKLNLSLTLTRDAGGFVALITGQGYVSDFDFNSSMDVHQSVMQKIEADYKNLQGQMDFHWQVAKNTAGVMAEESRIKLPGAIGIPLWKVLDGLPLYLEISAAILIHPGITAGSEVSKGAFRINYDGYQHFTAKSGTIDATGNVKGDILIGEQENISPSAPLLMLVAFSAPRVELTLGIEKIVDTKNIQKAADYVDQAADAIAKKLLTPAQYNAFKLGPLGTFTLGGALKNTLSTSAAATLQFVGTSASSYTGASVITPCSREDLNLVASVSVSAVAVGQSLGSSSKDIFKMGRSHVDPPGTALCENIGAPLK